MSQFRLADFMGRPYVVMRERRAFAILSPRPPPWHVMGPPCPGDSLSSFFFVIGSTRLWFRVIVEPAAQQFQGRLDLGLLRIVQRFEVLLHRRRHVARFRNALFANPDAQLSKGL